MGDLAVHLSAIVAGDRSAFASWLAVAEPCVRRGLRRFAATVDTEAVLQEALLRTWQVAPRHRPDGRPNGLLRQSLRIARNLAIDEVRRVRRHEPLDEAAEEVADEELAQPADPLLRSAFERCLALLPGRPREALMERLEDHGQYQMRS